MKATGTRRALSVKGEESRPPKPGLRSGPELGQRAGECAVRPRLARLPRFEKARRRFFIQTGRRRDNLEATRIRSAFERDLPGKDQERASVIFVSNRALESATGPHTPISCWRLVRRGALIRPPAAHLHRRTSLRHPAPTREGRSRSVRRFEGPALALPRARKPPRDASVRTARGDDRTFARPSRSRRAQTYRRC